MGEMSPVVAAVVDPLPHHGVVRVQVDGHVLVLRVQHVAELLQAAVLRAAAGGVAQVVHDVRHVHLPCNATVVSGGFACDVTCRSIWVRTWSGPRSAPRLHGELYLLC